MKDTLFFTGYPGFLASDLVSQIIQERKAQLAHIYLLVLPHEKTNAANKLARFQKEHQLDDALFSIVVGDITKENLAIEEKIRAEIKNTVTHVFHLAAIYDLAVEERLAESVNVTGTKNINDFVQDLNKLKRYIYFSTAYVSGNREGRIYEHELSKGQAFRNHYERTKYDAEVAVQAIMEDVPTTIIRPGIVKGHAQTGKTIKFDGLYFMLNMYDKLRWLPFIPLLQTGASPEGNFVSSDYLIRGTTFLAFDPIGEGKVYHLTDPKPYRMDALQTMLMENYLGKKPRGKLAVKWMQYALSFSSVRKYLQVEKEALDYFTVHSSYNATEAQRDLAKGEIYCQDLSDTIDAMINFYDKYKHDSTKQLKIN